MALPTSVWPINEVGLGPYIRHWREPVQIESVRIIISFRAEDGESKRATFFLALGMKWENDDDIKLPSMASSFSRDPLSTLLQPVLEGLFSQGNPILGICGEKALSVLDVFSPCMQLKSFTLFR